MITSRDEGRPRAEIVAFRIRPCRASDRSALAALGHPPGAVRALSPSLSGRLEWATRGVRVITLVAEVGTTGEILGTVQFVRSRRDLATWMFGHWRVATARRREGIGRLLVREGLRLLPGVRRLYSHVDWGNDASLAAHQRIGFEGAPEIWGSAELGRLSTIGPPSPPMRLEPVRPRSRTEFFPVYERAMGSLWVRLFPGLAPRNYLSGRGGHGDVRGWLTGAWRAIRGRAWSARREAGAVVLLVLRGSDLLLFLDPEACEASLLARVASGALALGFRRDREVELRGLHSGLISRAGVIRGQVLMGMPDVEGLRGRE